MKTSSETSTTIDSARRTPNGVDPLRDKWRPLWITLFAILLAGIATHAKAQDTPESLPTPVGTPDAEVVEQTLQGMTIVSYNGEKKWIPIARSSQTADRDDPDAVGKQKWDGQPGAGMPPMSSGRPRYAGIHAQLSNFDADADPDGWVATIQLFDVNGVPVVRRASAAFRLVPRVPTADYGGYVNVDADAMTWSSKLTFDRMATAEVRLPLSQRIRKDLGWQNSPRNFHAGPFFGELTVRVSVPGEGVFVASTVVPMRRSVLVDTRWPNR